MAEEPSGEEAMLRWIWGYARREGWSLIGDTKQPGTVIRGLVRNKTKRGRSCGPCRLRSGDDGKDKAIGCRRIYHKDEIADRDSATATTFSKNCYEPNLRAG